MFRFFAASAALVMVSLFMTGCVEVAVGSGGVQVVTTGPSGGVFNPNKVPRLVTLTPNVGPENQTTDFVIEGQNLLPNTPVVVTFGTTQFNGTTNNNGTQITSTSSPNGKFTAPAATGTVDVDVFITGQNPPTLQLPNGFTYLPPGAPALPDILTMTPNTSDENGGLGVTFTGSNVPVAAGMQIVVSFLFSTGDINLIAQQTVDDQWSITSNPAVPAGENFMPNDPPLDVTVVCTFSGGGLPTAIVVSVPTSPTDGNPFSYVHSGFVQPPDPEEWVVFSGLSAPNPANLPDSFVRSIDEYDVEADVLAGVTGLTSRYMFNGSEALAPNGTHFYPSPVMNSGVSWRDGNSTMSHFAVPEFDRTYTPAVAQGQPPLPPVTKPVTGYLYHHTSVESGTPGTPNFTGLQDGFFAAYSNGEVEVFNVGGQPIHEEIHIHEDFANNPYFAVAHDSTQPRLYVCRMDGQNFTASGANSNEINTASVTGQIQQLSLAMCGTFVYFSTTSGEVYRAPIDSVQVGVNPVATACNWPATGSHTVVSDQFSISGDNSTICFVAGTGTDRWTNVANPAPSTHDIFAIQNADTGNTNIKAVTDFAGTPGGAKQVVFWNLGDSPTSTYGVSNLDNGTNDRRVTLCGVNDFTGANLMGADVVVNNSGTLVGFVTREDRTDAENPPVTTPFVVYYLYVARVSETNSMIRVNSKTANNFGVADTFGYNMPFVPSFWFPRKTPNSGMDTRLVFAVAGIGNNPGGSDQHLYTADFVLTGGGGLTMLQPVDRSANTSAPYEFGASTEFNYVGAFPSPQGHVLFVIEARSKQLYYLDLRDGVTSLLEPVVKSHNSAPVVLPNNNTNGDPLENTYLGNGFANDPAGSVGLEHWGNQIRTLSGPGLNGSTQQYLLFTAEETAGSEDVYILQMRSLASPLPTAAINVTNIAGAGAIKLIEPSKDGNVLAVVKGTDGYPEEYRYSGVVQGTLYVVNDIAGMLNDNETALTTSATDAGVNGLKISRSVRWYHNADRYTLYFGEGTSNVSGTAPIPESYLKFTRLDLDRLNNNAIGQPTLVDPMGQGQPDGAIYIYAVGKRE